MAIGARFANSSRTVPAGFTMSRTSAAVILTLLHTGKLNDVDPQAWLVDMLAGTADHDTVQRSR